MWKERLNLPAARRGGQPPDSSGGRRHQRRRCILLLCVETPETLRLWKQERLNSVNSSSSSNSKITTKKKKIEWNKSFLPLSENRLCWCGHDCRKWRRTFDFQSVSQSKMKRTKRRWCSRAAWFLPWTVKRSASLRCCNAPNFWLLPHFPSGSLNFGDTKPFLCWNVADILPWLFHYRWLSISGL